MDDAKLNELATKYDPTPILKALNTTAAQPPSGVMDPKLMQSFTQGIMQPAAQPHFMGAASQPQQHQVKLTPPTAGAMPATGGVTKAPVPTLAQLLHGG